MICPSLIIDGLRGCFSVGDTEQDGQIHTALFFRDNDGSHRTRHSRYRRPLRRTPPGPDGGLPPDHNRDDDPHLLRHRHAREHIRRHGEQDRDRHEHRYVRDESETRDRPPRQLRLGHRAHPRHERRHGCDHMGGGPRVLRRKSGRLGPVSTSSSPMRAARGDGTSTTSPHR